MSKRRVNSVDVRGDQLNPTAFDNASIPGMIKETQFQIRATFEDVRSIGEPIDSLVRNMEACDESAVYSVKLAVHEICTNIVEHAYNFERDAKINIWLGLMERSSIQLTVKLTDSGRPFKDLPETHGEPSSNLDDHGEGGYGLFLAHALMDTVEYRRVDGYNVWRLQKELVAS